MQTQKEFIGSQLRAMRQLHRRTLKELGERAGFSLQYLSDVERGRTMPSLKAFLAICEALPVRPGAILDQMTRKG
jgi:transcriptional regulator with XRE-family HTH domain